MSNRESTEHLTRDEVAAMIKEALDAERDRFKRILDRAWSMTGYDTGAECAIDALRYGFQATGPEVATSEEDE